VQDISPALNCLDESVQGRWIGVIAFGGQCGQSQMVSHQELDQVGIALVKPNRFDGVPGNRRSPIRMMGASPRQLADVMEQTPQQQDVRPINLG
jgi:hypothetical protein